MRYHDIFSFTKRVQRFWVQGSGLNAGSVTAKKPELVGGGLIRSLGRVGGRKSAERRALQRDGCVVVRRKGRHIRFQKHLQDEVLKLIIPVHRTRVTGRTSDYKFSIP